LRFSFALDTKELSENNGGKDLSKQCYCKVHAFTKGLRISGIPYFTQKKIIGCFLNKNKNVYKRWGFI